MQDNFARILKATIISIIVALLFIGIVVISTTAVAGKQISTAISLINKMSVDASKAIPEEITLSSEKKRLDNYPEYGTQYGKIYIDSIGVDLPIYLGDTTEILKLGVGHFSGSYFPGEGGSIVFAAHNTAKFFRRLPEVKTGDTVKIKTDYGEFNYKVYDTQIIKETEAEKLPIQTEEEILMMYTCYPVTGIGHKSQRFVVYAELMEEK